MKPSTAFRAPRWIPLLALLLVLGGALRLVNLGAPPLDFQPTRQLRNSLVARAVYYDALPGADPEKRLLADSFRRAVGQYEPPITESIAGYTFLLTGGESFAVPRLWGTVFWLLAGIALFDLARRFSSPLAALASLAYYLILPFAVQASRSFQPDPLMTAAFVAGIYFLYRWSEEQRWKWAILAAAFLGLAVLVKIVIVFLVIGAAVAIVLVTFRRRFWRSPQVWAMVAIMALPAAAYYIFAHPARSSEYFFAWTLALIALITSPHFYADWLGFLGSLFDLTILFLSLAGVVLATARARSLLLGLWFGYFLYGLTLPFQIVTHSYYHIQLVPVVALGLAPVVDVLAERARRLTWTWRLALLVPAVVLLVYEAWVARSVLAAEDFSEAPPLWQSIAAALPQDADVIALTQDYGFDLMFWGWRRVDLWPVTTDLADFKNSDRDLIARFSEFANGDRYFLVTAFGQLESQPELKKVLDGYAVAGQGTGYILYDLQLRQ